MTREEAIKKLADADGSHGKLFSQGNWARTLVLSLEILGLLKLYEGEPPEMNDLYTRLRADGGPLATEAADEISRLQREIYIRDTAMEMLKDPERLKHLQEIKRGLKR